MSLPPAGWYPDPQSGVSERWWDGAAWTMQTRAPEVSEAPTLREPVSLVEEVVAVETNVEPEIAPEIAVEATDVVPPYAIGADEPAMPYPAAPAYPETPVAYASDAYAAAPAQPYGVAPAYPGAAYGAPTYPGQEAAVFGAAAGAVYGAPTYAHPQGAGYGIVPPVGVWRSPIDNRPLVTNMIDAVKVCFQKYVQFDGRASRSEFWYFTLAEVIVVTALYILLVIPFVGLIALPLLTVVSLGAMLPSFAVAIRRLRDAGQHWAWIFLLLVPLAGIALIVMWCQPTKYP